MCTVPSNVPSKLVTIENHIIMPDIFDHLKCAHVAFIGFILLFEFYSMKVASNICSEKEENIVTCMRNYIPYFRTATLVQSLLEKVLCTQNTLQHSIVCCVQHTFYRRHAHILV